MRFGQRRKAATGTSGGGRRRIVTWASALVAAVAAIAVLAISSAFAVHDTGRFELDGNAVKTVSDDWDEVCHEVTITNDPDDDITNECLSASDTNGATAVSWTAEPNIPSNSVSIFTGGGSKDPIDVSSWAWKDAGGLPDKDNLLHSFAARYSLPVDPDGGDGNTTACESDGPTCEVLYFGSDRFDNSGDAQQGFWFFQNKIELNPDVKIGGGFGFSGVHETGDLLVISNFSNGGTTSTISVYTWDPSVDGNLKLEATSTNAKCAPALAADSFCGIVNESTSLTDSPWSFLDKSGNTEFAQGEFYEGGVNLSALGLGDECFSSVASETRSSTSTTAVLKDFVLGQFGNCTATIDTQASNNGTVPPGTPITDTATIVGSNPLQPPTGSGSGGVDFFLCGPLAAGAEGCPTGGTSAGADKSLSSIGQPAGTAVATSDQVNTAANPLAPGRYCFRAFWPGDTNYVQAGGFSHTDNVEECFTVEDTSSILSDQVWLPNDSATITSAGDTNLSGTLDIKMYSGSTCSAGGTVLYDEPDITLTNAASPATRSTTNGSVAATTVTFDEGDSPVTISWQATFTPTAGSGVGGSTGPCETSTSLTIDDNDPTP